MSAFLGSFAATLIIGIPIAMALGIACLAYLWWGDNLGLLIAFPQRLIGGVDQFVLLTIPLFLLAGQLMNAGGITDRIVAFSRALIGHIRGGLSLVAVMASMIFSGVSGAATAEASALGSVLIPAMKKEGYRPDYAAALTAVSSVIGPIIPPSIALIVFGALSGTSIATLFVAGVIPGLLLAGGLMVYAAIAARRHDYPVHPRLPWAERGRAARRALPALFLPVIILGGILSGVFTPTESAAVAAVYAFAVAVFGYRVLPFAQSWKPFRDTAIVTAGIMFIVAMASMVAFIFAYEAVPSRIAEGMLGVSDNRYVLLLLINAFLLLLGLFLEPIAAMILIMPILIEIAALLGLDMVHLGVIVVLNLALGLATPPVGLCLFIVSAIGEEPVERVSLASLPLLGVCGVVLLAVTFIPALSLWLPRLVGL